MRLFDNHNEFHSNEERNAHESVAFITERGTIKRKLTWNIDAIQYKHKLPSTNKRNKEWLMAHRHTSGEDVFGQVYRKDENNNILITHWRIIREQSSQECIALEWCEGCTINDRRTRQSHHQCIFVAHRHDTSVLHQVIRDNTSMNKRWVLDILPGCSKNARISTMEAFLNDIKILDLEASIIDKLLHNERSKRIVMEELKKIQNLFTDPNEQIEIYTDGSLITNSSTMSRPIMEQDGLSLIARINH